MRAVTLLALVLGLVALAQVEAKSLTGDRVLVIMDDSSIRHSHSLFFADLTSTDLRFYRGPPCHFNSVYIVVFFLR